MAVRKTTPATNRRVCSRLSSWWMLTSTVSSSSARLSGDAHGGGRAPDREAEEEVGDHDRDDAGPDRPAHGQAHSGRAAGSGVAVVAVDEDDRDRQEHQLPERPEH